MPPLRFNQMPKYMLHFSYFYFFIPSTINSGSKHSLKRQQYVVSSCCQQCRNGRGMAGDRDTNNTPEKDYTMMEAEPPNNRLVLKKLEQMESADRNARFLSTHRTQFRNPLSHCKPGMPADGQPHLEFQTHGINFSILIIR